MGSANLVVETILKSPLHGVFSGSTILLRYQDASNADQTTMSVQYADAHHGLVVVAADTNAHATSWWQNFTDMGQVQVLFKGTWTAMTAHALVGADDPEAVTPLLRSYALRFPNVVKSLDGDDLDERVANTVVVWLRPAA